ncbi:UDP-N-acetylglucosamine diphosphorylase/glucosamine-1-phosphate N-acetyltransferase [Solemya velum gill symbiont]|uniref:bifunctional UDP-N-acetylglucosamine diphosphorylase/glucosamine-1-phosphate N-acetyltransferase GlmU n=1 Tax=Solemya velum gill symbiont TaxID=2340 RepID=UPI00099716E6|nr:bifunctional UDP-N-acetylglucosamine diphosphorylase/glucosamine-1-phosphate N-acetyltransferase GlmU [Solemya velum gill symbiont]OOZ18925.1 UDP-N-acetylglucosamine diphosphorylase/glucosamine-1-phosphate N-acetyltransferase [Solemya velum gill symbiont]OOZ28422.1 UDP-N-acetylglucosamine diphosphorylase/glucosamine-1-phosphate N-acetyltransferase [Solemya velum gill symbiont]
MKLGVVILAAGQGSRMKSAIPKVLHPIAGKPMLAHVIETARKLNPDNIVVVYGYGGELVRDQMASADVEWALQEQQLGTGHAVEQAMPLLGSVDRILVLYADVPLIRHETLLRLIESSADTNLGMLTVELDNPTGYGRIVRDEEGAVSQIVEQKDASAAEFAIHEVNVGIMLINRERLATWIERLDDNNAQGEFYLTDIISMAVKQGAVISTVSPDDLFEVAGVNDRVQLAELERELQSVGAQELMRNGVTVIDPARIDIRGNASVSQDVTLDVNVILEGDVELGEGVRVGANSILRNCKVAAGTVIKEMCVIEDAIIGESCQIGPFARIRPGTELAPGCHIGNFVEIKNAQVARDSKVNHLSYVGDATVGESVNIGAGTITCNYDGAYKHRTVIGDHVFVGSDTQLVAPVTVESGATIGAGSTITADVKENALALSRTKQRSVMNWKRPQKDKG